MIIMVTKKYTINYSACNNIYLSIENKLSLQDILDIKKDCPNIPLYELYTQILNINNIFISRNIKTFILYTKNKKRTEYLSNNCYLRINEDELFAEILINPESNLENILSDIQSANMPLEKINKQIVEEIYRKKINKMVVFAKGNTATQAEEYDCEYFFEYERSEPINIQQGTKGVYLDPTIENRTLPKQTMLKINNEDKIKGILGETITGKTIPIILEPKNKIFLTKNVYKEGNEIKSSIAGIASYDKDTIEVIPILTIKEPVINQDISFDGFVIIENTIKNSTIKATKDIVLYKIASSTKLFSDGYIYILTGITGNKSNVTSKNDIFCGYAHNASLTTSDGDIHIGYEAIQANLNSAKSIFIEKKAAGGNLAAKELIIMETCGSERITTKTNIQLSINTAENISFNNLQNIEEIFSMTEKKYLTATIELQKIEQSISDKIKMIHDTRYKRLMSIVFELQEDLKNLLPLLDNHKNKNVLSFDSEDKRIKDNFILIKKKVWNGTSIKINDKDTFVDKDASYASMFKLGNYGVVRKAYEEDSDI
jgi:hypothetical protein